MKKKKPYRERTYIEKYQTNMKITKRLLEKKEYSSAFLRAVTSLEIFMDGIIKEGLDKKKISSDISKELLSKFNLKGKSKFLFKIGYGINLATAKPYKELYSKAIGHRNKRNKIAHEGELRKKSEAKECIDDIEKYVERLIKDFANVS